jgi:cell division protease FtsH
MKRRGVGIDDIILNKEAKEEVDRYVRSFFKMKDAFEKNGMQHKRGIILEGPPGTGKTLLGKVMASEMEDITFIWGTAKDLADGMREIFKWARELTPAVLFLEDIDFFGMSRPISTKNYGVDITEEKEVSKAIGDDHDMGELLAQLDGFEGNDGLLVVATTNHVGALDEALKNRPGRFDVKITLSYPDEKSRSKLLKLWTRNLTLKNVDKLKLIAKTKGFTPAQIREIVNRAVLCAVDKGLIDDTGKAIITQSCFDTVLASWR